MFNLYNSTRLQYSMAAMAKSIEYLADSKNGAIAEASETMAG